MSGLRIAVLAAAAVAILASLAPRDVSQSVTASGVRSMFSTSDCRGSGTPISATLVNETGARLYELTWMVDPTSNPPADLMVAK